MELAREPEWPFIFLPGDIAPDELLRSVLRDDAGKDAVAQEFHKTRDQVKVAHDHVAGIDTHDLFPELSNALGTAPSVLRRGMIHLWLSVAENLEQARRFLEDLVKALDQSGP